MPPSCGAMAVPSSAGVPQFKKDMLDGKLKMGCAVNTSSSLVAELCAYQGFDFILIDAQHSAVNPETLRHLLTAVHAGGSKAIVRVAGHLDRPGIQQAFDLGADGILIPCSRTAEDIKQGVSCAKYPTNGPGSEGGSRSVYFNLRPQLPGGFGKLFDYVTKEGNDRTLVAAQIETKDALENIEEICQIDGLDICFIGPGDLATDMGLSREVGMPACFADERFKAAEKKIADTCKKYGKIAGYWNNDIPGKTELGFRFMVVDADIGALQMKLAENLAKFKEQRTAAGCE